MILLGINGGLGNSDVGWLPTDAIDMKHGWLDYPRPKTGIGRRIPLWKETIEALKTAQAERHAPNDPAHEPLLFISRHGKSYTDPSVNGFRVGQEMQITMDNAKIDDKPVRRQGLSFYTLRHTFQTVAEGARDLAAVQAIMGHAASNSDMSATYREGVNDERLKAVTDFVRLWLFERTCEACGEKFSQRFAPAAKRTSKRILTHYRQFPSSRGLPVGVCWDSLFRGLSANTTANIFRVQRCSNGVQFVSKRGMWLNPEKRPRKTVVQLAQQSSTAYQPQQSPMRPPPRTAPVPNVAR